MEKGLKLISSIIGRVNTFFHSDSSNESNKKKSDNTKSYPPRKNNNYEELEYGINIVDFKSKGVSDITKQSYPQSSQNWAQKPLYIKPLQAKDVLVNIVVVSDNLSEENMQKYIEIMLKNTNEYFLFIKANSEFNCMPVFCNIFSSKNENIKNVKNFLLNQNLSEEFLSLDKIVKRINDKSKIIVIPDMITLEQAKLEEAEYEKARKEEQKRQEEAIRNKEKEQEIKTEETKKPNDSISTLSNSNVKEDTLTQSVSQDKKVDLQKNEVQAKSKEQTVENNSYVPWNFKPSKPIYNIVIKSINIIGKNNILLVESNMETVKETKTIVTNFLKKNIDMIFYSIDDKNIEPLSLIGFRKIELLHEKFT